WPFTEVQNGNQREVMRKMFREPRGLPAFARQLRRAGSGCHECGQKRLNSMGASPTHTEDTALQTPVRFRSGQVVCYQSFARAQGGNSRVCFASSYLNASS